MFGGNSGLSFERRGGAIFTTETRRREERPTLTADCTDERGSETNVSPRRRGDTEKGKPLPRIARMGLGQAIRGSERAAEQNLCRGPGIRRRGRLRSMSDDGSKRSS